MQLTGKQYEELVAALINAFPDEKSLTQMVRYKLNENLAVLVERGNLGNEAFELVGWAEREGRIEDLRAAITEKSASPDRSQSTANVSTKGYEGRQPSPDLKSIFHLCDRNALTEDFRIQYRRWGGKKPAFFILSATPGDMPDDLVTRLLQVELIAIEKECHKIFPEQEPVRPSRYEFRLNDYDLEKLVHERDYRQEVRKAMGRRLEAQMAGKLPASQDAASDSPSNLDLFRWCVFYATVDEQHWEFPNCLPIVLELFLQFCHECATTTLSAQKLVVLLKTEPRVDTPGPIRWFPSSLFGGARYGVCDRIARLLKPYAYEPFMLQQPECVHDEKTWDWIEAYCINYAARNIDKDDLLNKIHGVNRTCIPMSEAWAKFYKTWQEEYAPGAMRGEGNRG